MTEARSVERLKAKDRTAFIGAGVSAVVSVLIWTLWVFPIVRTVEVAEPVAIGSSTSIELATGETVGIWASGRSATFGTLECTVTAPDGGEVPQARGASLGWEDLLWWMTPRRGFEQRSQVTAIQAGAHLVRCVDSLDTYDGDFLVAGDSFGTGDIGLGRTGSNDFSIGAVLVFCAVLCPPLAVLIPLVILLRRLVTRPGARPSR